MQRLMFILIFFCVVVPVNSQNWDLNDLGVGLIVEDENYDKELKIMQRGTLWDAKELYENGAQAGKYRGNQLFAAWIQGPHTNRYQNSNGVPVWSYKYIITYPDGKTFESGPHGFYTPGFSYFGVKTGAYTEGKWKIDFYIWNRDTKETRYVGKTEFQTTFGKSGQAYSDGWQLKEIGVGTYDISEYDKILKIIKKGDSWSQKELYQEGYFTGKDKAFGAWLVGPPTEAYLNSFGTPTWLCKFTVTYPDGSSQSFGPYNFYTPGFCTMGINASGNLLGKWKIQYFIHNRDTQESKLVGTKEFTLIK
jgi:hypothetical protein